MIKSELRKLFLAKQKSLSNFERNEKSRKIADGFFGNFDLKNIRFLHVFLAIEKNKEIETQLIYERLWRDFPEVTTIISRVDFQTMTLENLKFAPDTKLVQNKWHIFEPTEGELIDIEKIDLVLIPLLCFDARGFRVSEPNSETGYRITQIPHGATLTVLGCPKPSNIGKMTGRWCQVIYNGQSGWAFDAFMTF
jgi:5-formyltetrahydrofolate cyclo-ligase